MRLRSIAVLAAATSLLAACNTPTLGTATRISTEAAGAQVDTTGLVMQDYVDLAGQLTDEMLQDEVFVDAKKRPRLIVGAIRNNTDNENIRVGDIHDKIEQIVLTSKMARLMDASSTSFDYVVQTELTNQRVYGRKGGQDVTWELKLILSSLSGERLGIWSGDTRRVRKVQ